MHIEGERDKRRRGQSRRFELVFVKGGAGQHGIAYHRVAVMSGDLHLIAPGEPHDSSDLGRAGRRIVALDTDALDPGRGDM